jgi:hypothetical protein
MAEDPFTQGVDRNLKNKVEVGGLSLEMIVHRSPFEVKRDV